MNYERLSNEELQKFPFPNLVAEIIESGYGYPTIVDFMGHERQENSEAFVLPRLRGEIDILASEAFGLARYYGCKLEYMFSSELSVINGKPEAYWRWYEENKRKKEEHERSKAVLSIYEEIKNNPHLLSFMQTCITLNEEQRKEILNLIQLWREPVSTV